MNWPQIPQPSWPQQAPPPPYVPAPAAPPPPHAAMVHASPITLEQHREFEQIAMEVFTAGSGPPPQLGQAGWPEIPDEPAWDRWCARLRQLYGGLPPETRTELGFRDLAAMANAQWHDKPTIARFRFIWRRMEEAWDAYRVNVLGLQP